MSSTIAPADLGVLYSAAAAARLAPSIHNSQPWRFRTAGHSLEIALDTDRLLPVIDPVGRQALISCGCALFNARVALSQAGRPHRVSRFPDGLGATTVARLELLDTPERNADPGVAALGKLVGQRTTNRGRFQAGSAPEMLINRLGAAANAEEAILFAVRRADQRAQIAGLTRQADALQNADAAYRAELRAWTTADPTRLDGVPDAAISHVTGDLPAELPLRDFDTRGTGRLAPDGGVERDRTLLVLGTDSDDQWAWLRTGEALERVLLELTRAGWAGSPVNQALETPQTRAEVERLFGGTVRPQVLLRVGKAAPTPRTPRRRMSDLLTEER